jgi:hypothetical protein
MAIPAVQEAREAITVEVEHLLAAEKGQTEREDPSPCLSPVRGKERRETGEREANSLASGSLASSSP